MRHYFGNMGDGVRLAKLGHRESRKIRVRGFAHGYRLLPTHVQF